MPDIHLHTTLLALPLFLGMSRNDIAEVVAHTRFGFVKVGRNKTVVGEGDVCDSIYILTSGQINIMSHADDYSYSFSEVIDSPTVIQPERIFGLTQRYSITVTAATACHLIKLSKSEILRLSEQYEIFRLNLLNIIPLMLGVAVYSLIRKQPFGKNLNFFMFSTAIAPLITHVLFYYPVVGDAPHLTFVGVLLALIVGVVFGCAMPALCAHSPGFHKGYDLYNAGPAAGGKRAVNGLSRERDKNIRLFPHHKIMQVRAPCERFCGSSLPFFGRQKSYMNSADKRVQFIFVRIGPFGCHDDFIAVLCELSRQIGDNALGSAVGQAVQMKCYLHNTRFSRISVSVSVSACRYRSGVYVSARSFAASL